MKLVYVGVLLAGFTVAACQAAKDECAADESSCTDGCANLTSDKDNCGACGSACGDGMVCSASQCVPGCDGDESRCNGVCVDETTDVGNCGACGSACTSDQVCSGGTCGCATNDIVCGGTCTDPTRDDNHCGASGDCSGSNLGTHCGTNEGCIGGVCSSTLIYRGSLPASSGVWTYGGTPGLPGANALCASHWPGAGICTYAQLMSAAAETPSELVNATDYNGVAIAVGATTPTDWWIDDATAAGTARCLWGTNQPDANKAGSPDGPGIPWSYGTAHLGNVGKYVTLTPATGAITAIMTGVIANGTGLCASARFVPCCTIDPAP